MGDGNWVTPSCRAEREMERASYGHMSLLYTEAADTP